MLNDVEFSTTPFRLTVDIAPRNMSRLSLGSASP